MTDEELARRLTEALDTRIDRAASAPVSREILNRLPEPETIGGTVVEAIPVRQARWKSALAAVLAILMLGGVGLLVFRLAGRTDPTQDPYPAHSGSTEETGTTEPTVEIPLPEVSFDETSRTLRVVGTGGYDRIDLSRLPDALNFEVVDDDFTLTVLPSLLWDETCSIKDDPVGYMPGYLDRIDKSLAVIRQFVADNAPNEEVAAQTRKPVKMSLQTFKFNNYRNNPDEISLILGGGFRWHGVLYTMGLMAPESVEWQHIGYAYWVGFCVDPYNSVYTITEEGPDPDYFYFDAYYRAGGTEDWLDLDNQKLMTDACSWYDLVYGRDWDGTEAECGRISDNAWFTGSDKYKDGNGMSLSMAESLLNYLAERCGADRVTAYCFDACSFEEAFGMSFAEARAAWEQSLLDRFGDGGEAAFPEVSFDEETKTLRVVGTEGYDRLDLTPYLSDARYLEVEDDAFRFSADAAILKELLEQVPYQVGVPGYLDRLDRGTAFIRQFIRAKASDEQVAAQLGKSVHYTLKTLSSAWCTNTAEGIELELGPDALEYDARYALSLTKPGVDTWKSLGFAYWLGCVDPCNFVSVFDGTPTSPDSDYFYLADYFRVGGTGKTWEAKEKLLCMDACSWYILTRGRDWAGADAELRPIWKFPSSSRKEEDEGNDLSLFMAISLINYLAEQHGEDKVIACCFDTCTFEETFGMSFSEARAAWEQSLLDRFGDGEVQTAEPTEDPALPAVSFDEATKTLRVTGTGGYDRIDLSRLPDAQIMEVVDDDFTLTIFSSILWDEDTVIRDDPEGYLPGYLDRIDGSLAVIRQFVADNAPNEEVAAQTRKPVKISLQSMRNENFRNTAKEISLYMGSGFPWHGLFYTMALMAPKSVEWQHIGYAYWVSYCVDPYNSVYALMQEGPDPDYFYLGTYYRAGGTEDWLDPNNQVLIVDACSWYNLIYGRDWGGSEAECGRISDETMFTGKRTGEGNDMSIGMAESLLNYLAGRCGADKVTAYCFDTCSFEEAFGMSFAEARSAWEQSLLDRFGDGSEPETQPSP